MSYGNQFNQEGAGFGQEPMQPPQKQGMSTTMIVVIVVGSVGGISLLCCAGACGSAMFFGMGQIGNVAKSEFSGHPDVQQQIGEIESASVNFAQTGDVGSQVQEDNVFVLDVEGSKGSGQFILKYDGEMQSVIWGKMITDQGETTLKGNPPL